MEKVKQINEQLLLDIKKTYMEYLGDVEKGIKEFNQDLVDAFKKEIFDLSNRG